MTTALTIRPKLTQDPVRFSWIERLLVQIEGRRGELDDRRRNRIRHALKSWDNQMLQILEESLTDR